MSYPGREILYNDCKVLDSAKLQEILQRYELFNFTITIDDDGYLRLETCDDDYGGHMAAVRLDRLPNREDYPDDESWDEDIEDIILDAECKGLDDLIAHINPVLDHPLFAVELDSIPDEIWVQTHEAQTRQSAHVTTSVAMEANNDH
jgi:hypothetical protein